MITDILGYTFFQNALLGVIIISIAGSMIGTYIVTRRMVFITGGITHASFGGLGLGFYAGINPTLTASLFAVASAIGVELMSAGRRVREDSAIAVVWALGMAVGILFIFMTPGYVPELSSFLFGNILTITHTDLAVFGVYTVILIAFFSIFYRQIVCCAFDVDFSRTRQLPVKFINYSMTVLVSICVVLTIRLVGIMLLMSMLTLPQMIAEQYTVRYGRMLMLSVVTGIVCSVSGLFVSYFVDVPASATIVIVLIVSFFVSRMARSVRTKMQYRA